MDKVYITTQKQLQIDNTALMHALFEESKNNTEFYKTVYSKRYKTHHTKTITQDVECDGHQYRTLNALANTCEYFLVKHPNLGAEYYSFNIPKRTGGMRTITAPTDELKKLQKIIVETLRDKLLIFESDIAFAYVPGRSIKDAVNRHRVHASNFFLKIDFKNFFDSCTESFIVEKLKQIYPLNKIPKKKLALIVKVMLYQNHLPQGGVTSPYISNIIMTEFDKKITLALRKFKDKHYCVTRYADDIIVSTRTRFKAQEIVDEIKRLLVVYRYPITINDQKTSYHSRKGKNWNLGLMLNKDNNITIGYKQRRLIKSRVHFMLKQNATEITWNISDIRNTLGLLANLHQIVPHTLDTYIERMEKTYNITIKQLQKRI